MVTTTSGGSFVDLPDRHTHDSGQRTRGVSSTTIERKRFSTRCTYSHDGYTLGPKQSSGGLGVGVVYQHSFVDKTLPPTSPGFFARIPASRTVITPLPTHYRTGNISFESAEYLCRLRILLASQLAHTLQVVRPALTIPFCVCTCVLVPYRALL